MILNNEHQTIMYCLESEHKKCGYHACSGWQFGKFWAVYGTCYLYSMDIANSFKSLENDGITYTSKVRCDENHEDVVEEEKCHEQSHDPSFEEGEPTQQIGNESKAKNILNNPGIGGMTLHQPPNDNTKTKE